MALAGEGFWEHYELSCLVRSAGDGGIGLVLYYRDDQNYDWIRWATAASPLPYAGRLEWVRRRGGRDTVAGSIKLDDAGDAWHELRVSPAPGINRLLVDGREVLAVPASEDDRGAVGLFSEDNAGSFFDNVRVDFF